MGKLSRPRRSDSIRPSTIDRFGGIDRRPGAQNGAIFDTKNMHGGDYPCAASRPGMKEVTVPFGSFAPQVHSFEVINGDLYTMGDISTLQRRAYFYKWDSTDTGNAQLIEEAPGCGYSWKLKYNPDQDYYSVMGDPDARNFAYVGNYLCIFPDMMVYDTEAKTLRPIKEEFEIEVESVGQGKNVSIIAGGVVDKKVYEYGILEFRDDGVTKLNFAAGDFVEIGGLKKGSDVVSLTLQVQGVEKYEEFSPEYIRIAFENGTFENLSVPADGSDVSLKRNPNLPFIKDVVEVNGRVWGYYKNEIYASALNDPFNWEKHAQLSTDSWNTPAAGEGEITGVFEWNGAPYFMKETGIIRIYGSYAQEFMQQMTKCVGMYAGNERSVALCGGAIYYNSPLGIMRFAGTVPVPVSAEFGSDVFRYSAGGSDGRTYFVSLWNEELGDDGDLWAYDTLTGDWHRYAEGRYTRLFFDGRLWGRRAFPAALLIISGDTGAIAPARLTDEAAFETTVRFADFTGSYGSYQSRSYYGRKGVSRIDVRATLDPGVTMRIWIAYDAPCVPDEGDARWIKVSEATALGAEKRTVRVPVIVRRCDHFALMITTEPGSAAGATGRWVLNALTVFKYQGTDLH